MVTSPTLTAQYENVILIDGNGDGIYDPNNSQDHVQDLSGNSLTSSQAIALHSELDDKFYFVDSEGKWIGEFQTQNPNAVAMGYLATPPATTRVNPGLKGGGALALVVGGAIWIGTKIFTNPDEELVPELTPGVEVVPEEEYFIVYAMHDTGGSEGSGDGEGTFEEFDDVDPDPDLFDPDKIEIDYDKAGIHVAGDVDAQTNDDFREAKRIGEGVREALGIYKSSLPSEGWETDLPPEELERAGDLALEAMRLYEQSGNYIEAQDEALLAVSVYRAAGHDEKHAVALRHACRMGDEDSCVAAGEYSRAVETYERFLFGVARAEEDALPSLFGDGSGDVQIEDLEKLAELYTLAWRYTDAIDVLLEIVEHLKDELALLEMMSGQFEAFVARDDRSEADMDGIRDGLGAMNAREAHMAYERITDLLDKANRIASQNGLDAYKAEERARLTEDATSRKAVLDAIVEQLGSEVQQPPHSNALWGPDIDD